MKASGNAPPAPTARIAYQVDWLAGEAPQRAHLRADLAWLSAVHGLHDRDVVELGSGLGHNLRLLMPHNRVLGLEGLDEAVTRARADGVPTLQADLNQPLPLPDGCADWLLCLDVLEHLIDPLLALCDGVRLLRPGGMVLVNLPNHFDWRGRLRLLRGSGIDSQRYFPGEPVWHYPHLRFFRSADAQALLAAAGLQLVADLSSRHSSLPKAAWWRRRGAGAWLEALARRWPDLLQPGFLLLARKP